ncbi:MAG: acetyl-CoA carboxylase biotin carboxylase subunit [Firmicutes bacterium]|uniref:Biotin carboxylase n=1 Tax=Sulfobacillus benefaciens TaxID=453960 RepID=A0A2T2XBL0_9FIRM|nr:acetyl-CoA carboxylase biotin carboxylase subunit [Bacillota bacterium]MCL5014784.1 acetyl-CoA carboxylase biotin carboxylase subunit [Bacillota bacterium]PSR31894.1 MAG: acetyl-CoA carboxylase biotin carboxylase subunit [Sulfobacillus benefaciens]HBQ96726.1 acetyl-CoA carboxylase biotin carboxylase subunit [Sulfobacillus sp.]
MFKKILVANRGEIAIRVMRAARDLGIKTVAVYSDADKEALHVKYADESFPIGPAPSNLSYLHIPNIINAAVQTGAEAIHPGYGFLSENHHFAAVCQTWGIKFIGPPAEAIEKMGIKAQARQMMNDAGVPVVPGTTGTVENLDDAKRIAEEIGYPVLVKASYGGGGRGIRVVESAEELQEALERASREAKSAFGQGDMYIEKYLRQPRHIEIQVIADEQGHIVTLGERESSLQRRRQKVLEEAPSVAITSETREKMSQAAIRAARAVNYTSAGTLEFLLDEEGKFYFMEMNTRVQVEHTCTEMITGVDIVKEQIRVAQGLPLSLTQADVALRGWAIECRINAEDPEQQFRPSPGKVTQWREPGGPWVRVDSGADTGYQVQPFYDSLLAKLVTWGRTRDEAIERMRRALSEFKIEGVKTTLELHKQLMEDEDFCAGKIHTNFLAQRVKGA